MHNPNPFDFVPFAANGPFLRTPDEYKALGPRLSGYLEIKIKALTPVHIVGSQQPGTEGHSFIYTQNDRPCIPAASIRGCLRAFIEALTSSWVSQANLEYPKVPGPYAQDKRHVGFRTFKDYSNSGRTMRRISPPAVNPEFEPKIRQDGKIDITSYLFGLVIEPENNDQKKKSPAWKSKIWIEDAFIKIENLAEQIYWVPDIKHANRDSFMGGGKPSASNWWYLQPSEVWQRNTPGGQIVEFIGDKFWGRKFYYHQNPLKCVAYYDPSSPQFKWKYSNDRPFYRVWLQCLEQEAETDTFRVYLDKIPEPLVTLFVLCLLPGKNIRHKLGYGKAYGYGSIEFSLEAARLRNDDAESRIPAALSDLTNMIRGLSEHAWDKGILKKFDTFIDWKALAHLARVLGWQDYDELLFTYPPFSRINDPFRQADHFAHVVPIEAFNDRAPTGVTPPVRVTLDEAHQIAEGLFNFKKPLHFRYYQQNAEGWNIISTRKP